MCGICGVVGFEDRSLVKKMTDVLEHRGPDDDGYFFDSGIGLGHRRLSIIDLSKGKQPIHNENKTIWIVFNGEIYNYKKLRDELEKKGHRFYTDSDTETIVHLYEELGDSCLKQLQGMFAFALWDSERKILFLARDRLGIKPLYYALIDGNILFASEIKSILQYEGIKREINHKSMDNYFTFRYVPGSETIFKGIKKLLPGHFLKFFNNDTLIRKYWDIELSERKKSEQYYSDLILKFLEDSVKMRLISDVPLGAYLSGGLDSSAIVGIMSKFSEKPVKTFSVKFEDETIDESQYAKMVAEHFKTEHHELMVKCSAMETLPKITWHLDEPLADPACIPTLLMSELTKKHVTVVLTGEGSDELFAGYDQYKFINMANRYGFAFRISSILPHKSLKFRRFKNYVKTKNYLSLLSVFDENEKESLYTETVSGKIDNTNIRIDGNSLNNILLFDTKTWLPDDLLVKNDRMTMAHAIEARVPFLDHRFVELSSSIPLRMKLKGKNDKYIYRKAISNLIPKQILKRKKHGFTVPINSWLDGELGEIVSQMFSEINVSKRGYFNHRTVQKILRNHNESQPYYKRQAWSLFTFELWNRMFMDSENINKPNLNILR